MIKMITVPILPAKKSHLTRRWKQLPQFDEFHLVTNFPLKPSETTPNWKSQKIFFLFRHLLLQRSIENWYPLIMMLRFLYRWGRSERILSRSAYWQRKVSSRTSGSCDLIPVRFGGQRSLEIILEFWRETVRLMRSMSYPKINPIAQLNEIW